MFRKKRKKSSRMEFEPADDVKVEVLDLVKRLDLTHIQPSQIYCVRSYGSRARAHARIWGLSRIFQVAAGFRPTYVIEVLSKHFDNLPRQQQTKVLIHELLHIPRTFSGALKQHRGRYHRIDHREVERLYRSLR